MNTSGQPFQAAQFFQDGVGVKTLKASDYVYHTSTYTPIRSLGVNYRNASGLRGGNSGMYPSERNTQSFALAASNLSSTDYRTMMAASNAANMQCQQMKIRLDQIAIKLDQARNDSERADAKKEYDNALQSYNQVC